MFYLGPGKQDVREHILPKQMVVSIHKALAEHPVFGKVMSNAHSDSEIKSIVA